MFKSHTLVKQSVCVHAHMCVHFLVSVNDACYSSNCWINMWNMWEFSKELLSEVQHSPLSDLLSFSLLTGELEKRLFVQGTRHPKQSCLETVWKCGLEGKAARAAVVSAALCFRGRHWPCSSLLFIHYPDLISTVQLLFYTQDSLRTFLDPMRHNSHFHTPANFSSFFEQVAGA